MVEVDRGDHRDIGVDGVRGVPLAAQPDLDHRDVDRGVGEDRVRERDHHLEEAHLDVELAVDEIEVGRQFAITLDERACVDRLAVEHDPLGDVGQVRAGEPAGAQPEPAQQFVDHARGGGLAVRAGEVDRSVAALRLAEQVEQRLDPLAGRVHAALAPPAGDLGLDLPQQRRVPLLLSHRAVWRQGVEGRADAGRCRLRRRRAGRAPSPPRPPAPCR